MKCVVCHRTIFTAKQLGIHFYNFPHDDTKWLEACKLKENKPEAKLCGSHFTVEDFEDFWDGRKRTRLKKNAVPSRFAKNISLHCIACREFPDDFYKFPSNKIVKQEWREACRRNGLELGRISPNYSLCSKHFTDDCFYFNKDKTLRYLNKKAVPSLFENSRPVEEVMPDTVPVIDTSNQFSTDVSDLPQEDSPESSFIVNSSTNISHPIYLNDDDSAKNIREEKIKSGIKRRLEYCDGEKFETSLSLEKRNKILSPTRIADFNDEHFDSPRKAKRNFRILHDKCKSYQRELRNVKSRYHRLVAKIRTLENLVSHLQDKKLISEDTVALLTL